MTTIPLADDDCGLRTILRYKPPAEKRASQPPRITGSAWPSLAEPRPYVQRPDTPRPPFASHSGSLQQLARWAALLKCPLEYTRGRGVMAGQRQDFQYRCLSAVSKGLESTVAWLDGPLAPLFEAWDARAC